MKCKAEVNLEYFTGLVNRVFV